MRKKANIIALREFQGKNDKGGYSYIGHLTRVASCSVNYFLSIDNKDEDFDKLEVIGLLHDLIEDCPEWNVDRLSEMFCKDVIDAIDLLTKKPSVNYEQYINRISENRFATAVKLADLKDNMDLTRLKEITDKDIDRVKKYHKSYKFLFEKQITRLL